MIGHLFLYLCPITHTKGLIMGKIIINIKKDKLYSVEGTDTEVEIRDNEQTHYMIFRKQEEIYERGKADNYFRDTDHQISMEKGS